MKLEKKKQAIEAVQYTGDNEQEVIDFFVKRHTKIKKSESGSLSLSIAFSVELDKTDWILDNNGTLTIALDSFVQEYYKEIK